MTRVKQTSLASIVCLSSIALSATSSAQQGANSQQQALLIEEIIVTAQRREQGIQDVANSIQALTGSDLDQFAKVGLEDYINSIGGIGYTRTGSGSVKLGMRGISPVGQIDQFAFAQTVSTVGVYLDDVAIQGAGSLPDLNLYDLQRIEVLKGPQGTLYGDGAMGGAIKMILNKPDLSEFSAKAEVTAIDTRNADVGHRIRGAVSVPIIQNRLALRLVGSTEEKKGWIDNIATGEDGVNDTDSWSLRATVLAQISDALSAEFLLMHDQQDIEGYAQEVIGLEDYQTNLLEDEFSDTEIDLYAMTLKYDLGFAELTSISSLFEKQRTLASRVSLSVDELFIPLILAPAPPLGFGLGFDSLPLGFADNSSLSVYDEDQTFSQELRLVSAGDNVVDWTLGLFYRDRDRDVCTTFDSPATQALNDYLPDFFGLDLPATSFECEVTPASGLDSTNRVAKEIFEQKAVYGELNWALTDSLELTAGFRYFDEEVTFEDEPGAEGVFDTVFRFAVPASTNVAKDDDVLFKLGLSWAASDDQLYYLNVAEGFRSGGSNLQATRTFEPERFRSYPSDSLINYELGAKTSWLNDRLTVNGALYYSDWSDIQTAISVPSIDSAVLLLTPGGDAEIKGIELSMLYLASEQLLSGFSFNAQLAEFTDTIADANIVEGSDLPNAPELTASFFVQYSQPLELGELFTRVEYRYVDEQRSVVQPIVSAAPPYDDETTILPNYSVTDLTIGLRSDRWYVTAYVNNLFDKRYLVSYGYAQSFFAEGSNPTLTSVGTPRTVGLTVGTQF